MTDKRRNEFSSGWAAVGALVFAATIAAPFGVLHLSERLSQTEVPVAAGKTSETALAEARVENNVTPDLKNALSDALIVPGVGIGMLALGQDVTTVTHRLPAESIVLARENSAGGSQHLAFRIEAIRIGIQIDDNRVSSVELYTRDCAALSDASPRQQALPATAEGLTVGSHLSRVIAHLGEPVRGAPMAPIPGRMPLPDEMVYPGLTLGLCPENGLISSMRVNRPDGLQTNPALVLFKAPSDPAPRPGRLAVIGDSAPDSARVAAGHTSFAAIVPGVLTTPSPLKETPYEIATSARQPLPEQAPSDLPIAAYDVHDGAMIVVNQLTEFTVLAAAPSQPGTGPLPTRQMTVPTSLADASGVVEQDDPLMLVKSRAALPLERAQPDPALNVRVSKDATHPPYHASAEKRIAIGPVDRLYTPRSTPSEVERSPIDGVLTAEAAEEALDLDRRSRQALQQRLRLLGYDTNGVDGIFGPSTRSAIASFQTEIDHLPTGFIDGSVKELLETRTSESYARLVRDQRRVAAARRKARQSSFAPVLAVRLPAARQQPKCRRDENGLIAPNQGPSCDWDYLREDLISLFGGNRS